MTGPATTGSSPTRPPVTTQHRMAARLPVAARLVRPRAVSAAVALVLVMALGGCGLWGTEGGPGGAGIAAPTSSPSATAVDAVLGPDGVQRVEISAGDDLRFSPSLVRARPGLIEFVFHNVGQTPHAVEVGSNPGSPAAATGNVNGGQRQTVRLTVDTPGRYPFPCVYHVSSGMQGTLEVLGPTAP